MPAFNKKLTEEQIKSLNQELNELKQKLHDLEAAADTTSLPADLNGLDKQQRKAAIAKQRKANAAQKTLNKEAPKLKNKIQKIEEKLAKHSAPQAEAISSSTGTAEPDPDPRTNTAVDTTDKKAIHIQDKNRLEHLWLFVKNVFALKKALNNHDNEQAAVIVPQLAHSYLRGCQGKTDYVTYRNQQVDKLIAKLDGDAYKNIDRRSQGKDKLAYDLKQALNAAGNDIDKKNEAIYNFFAKENVSQQKTLFASAAKIASNKFGSGENAQAIDQGQLATALNNYQNHRQEANIPRNKPLKFFQKHVSPELRTEFTKLLDDIMAAETAMRSEKIQAPNSRR